MLNGKLKLCTLYEIKGKGERVAAENRGIPISLREHLSRAFLLLLLHYTVTIREPLRIRRNHYYGYLGRSVNTELHITVMAKSNKFYSRYP